VSGPALVLVYNADSGFMITLLDIGHKVVSPSICECRLCALTQINGGHPLSELEALIRTRLGNTPTPDV
jgi:hypothetical protein